VLLFFSSDAPIWPYELPQVVLASGYSEGAAGNLIISEVDVGPPKRRLRDLGRNRHYTVSMRLSTDQRQVFLDFWDRQIAQGALQFYFPHPITHIPRKFALSARGHGGYTLEAVAPQWFLLSLVIWGPPE